ncbi:MAG: hypothetical protein F6J93_19150 [Oscillatoria sp. SIO1A7]|nr:hypothetical protein [Oscillatoria sp. SIO1A7]
MAWHENAFEVARFLRDLGIILITGVVDRGRSLNFPRSPPIISGTLMVQQVLDDGA